MVDVDPDDTKLNQLYTVHNKRNLETNKNNSRTDAIDPAKNFLFFILLVTGKKIPKLFHTATSLVIFIP
jgi:hypothetical protein